MDNNKNFQTNGWTEYGKLVLDKLEFIQNELEKRVKTSDEQYKELKDEINSLNVLQKEIVDLKEWKNKTQEVWSVPQMKESKDEIYKQKNKWTIVIGVTLTIQILAAIYTFIKNSNLV